MTDLSTTYLGLNLKNPLVASASPLSKKLESARKLEEAGMSAIVMYSLFEEQINADTEGTVHHMKALNWIITCRAAPTRSRKPLPIYPMAACMASALKNT